MALVVMPLVVMRVLAWRMVARFAFAILATPTAAAAASAATAAVAIAVAVGRALAIGLDGLAFARLIALIAVVVGRRAVGTMNVTMIVAMVVRRFVGRVLVAGRLRAIGSFAFADATRAPPAAPPTTAAAFIVLAAFAARFARHRGLVDVERIDLVGQRPRLARHLVVAG
ncbi:MAG TPA: hypothetical protein VK552_05495, partial [Reyranella sp.]|nr:hypothetical protein [Reyranella sp.]